MTKNSTALDKALKATQSHLHAFAQSTKTVKRGFALMVGDLWSLHLIGHFEASELKAYCKGFASDEKDVNGDRVANVTMNKVYSKLGVQTFVLPKPDKVEGKNVKDEVKDKNAMALEEYSTVNRALSQMIKNAVISVAYLALNWRSKVEVSDCDVPGIKSKKEVKGCIVVPVAATTKEAKGRGTVSITPMSDANSKLLAMARDHFHMRVKPNKSASGTGVSVDTAIKTLTASMRDPERAVESQHMIAVAMEAISKAVENITTAKQSPEFRVAQRDLAYSLLANSHGLISGEVWSKVENDLLAWKSPLEGKSEGKAATIRSAIKRQRKRTSAPLVHGMSGQRSEEAEAIMEQVDGSKSE